MYARFCKVVPLLQKRFQIEIELKIALSRVRVIVTVRGLPLLDVSTSNNLVDLRLHSLLGCVSNFESHLSQVRVVIH